MANLYNYNTSTARKLDDAEIVYGRNLHKELQRQARKNSNIDAKPKTKKGISNIVMVAMCFLMAFAVVDGYVKINEANNEISSLANEYNDIVASNQALQVKIDKAVDLKELQTLAGEKFGMMRPERYQMFYVDLEMEDSIENTVAKGKEENQDRLAKMGAVGIITGTLNLVQ